MLPVGSMIVTGVAAVILGCHQEWGENSWWAEPTLLCGYFQPERVRGDNLPFNPVLYAFKPLMTFKSVNG